MHSSGWTPEEGNAFERRAHEVCEHSHLQTLDCECSGCHRLIAFVQAEIAPLLTAAKAAGHDPQLNAWRLTPQEPPPMAQLRAAIASATT